MLADLGAEVFGLLDCEMRRVHTGIVVDVVVAGNREAGGLVWRSTIKRR